MRIQISPQVFMIILSILFILLSNAVTLRRDISIIFNRIAILSLTYCILQDSLSLYVINKGIGRSATGAGEGDPRVGRILANSSAATDRCCRHRFCRYGDH